MLARTTNILEANTENVNKYIKIDLYVKHTLHIYSNKKTISRLFLSIS